jgi:Kelch motif/Galactose oxidase, central domain
MSPPRKAAEGHLLQFFKVTLISALLIGAAGGILKSRATPVVAQSAQARVALPKQVGYWSDAAPLPESEVSMAAVLLKNGDPLLTGGEAVTYGQPTRAVQRYAVGSGKWSTASPMLQERIGHTASLLKDGRVLVVGGLGKKLQPIKTAEVYNPTRNAWTRTRVLPATRFSHSASVLPDGRVLVVGGIVNTNISRSTLIFDPRNLTWKPGPASLYPHAQQDAVTLAGGQILIAGGYGGSAEIFDPKTARWTPAGGPSLRAHPVLQVLPDGNVLFASGVDKLGHTFVTSDLFNPKTDRWQAAAPMPSGRDTPMGVELRDGRVLIAGGGFNQHMLRSAEIYDSRSNRWLSAAPMHYARSAAAALLLRTGKVLVCGGSWFGSVLSSCELYRS